MNLNKNIYDLIIKDLLCDISEEEKLNLESKLADDLELRQKKNILYTFWLNLFPKKSNHQIIQKTEKKLGFDNKSKTQFSLSFLYKIAATVLLVLSLGFIAYQQFKPHAETSLNQYVTEQGKIRNIVLCDGTKVWLNSHSVLIASEPFIDDIREVLLIGEGYFEVTSDKSKPFIIKTPFMKTKVLGTHFNISAYPGDDNLVVSLYEGKVELSDANSPCNNLVMSPGEKTSFSINEKNFITKQNNLEKPAEWRDGVIRFYDENFNSIAKKLERKFMTRIFIVDEKVGKLNFTGSFDTEPLDKILQLLSEAHEFKILKTSNGIIIKSLNTNI